MVKAIRFFDMFSGIGGFRSGLEKAGGFKCIGNCEIDKHAEAAYKAMYDTEGEKYFSDARTIDPSELGDFDLITAGFPCQPFSCAGRQLSFDDPRGTLFLEIARLVEARRPAFFLLENVPGLLSINKGETFKVILETFSNLGYLYEWMVLNSANFGVPQQRRRLYIVGYTREECAGRIFPVRGGDAQALKLVLPGPQGSRVYDPEGSACTQCAGSGGGGGKTGLYFMDLNPDPLLTDEARCVTARQDSGISKRRGEHSGVFIESDEPCAVINPFKENTWQNGRRIKEPNEPMFTITAQDRHGVLHKGYIRRLTPLECWRLQGFEDDQFYLAYTTTQANTHLYRMAGNSVTVPVITAIAEKIKAAAEMIGLDTT